MRNIITCILLFFVLHVFAFDVNRNVESGLQDMRNGKIEEAIKKLKRASATNDVLAQFYIAQCQEYGIGMEKDLQAAFLMYRRTAERGFAPGLLSLARCYRQGIGIDINERRASELMSRYNKRTLTPEIPDLLAIYKEGIINIGKYDMAANNTKPAQPVLSSTISGQIQTGPVAKPEDDNIPDEQGKEQNAPVSDVDIDIPVTGRFAEHVFALIIANENYQDVANVPYALNDGETMAEYCSKILGLPTSNIHLVKDATLNNVKREINLMGKIAEAYNGEITLIVYYAGHGIPDEKTSKAYLMPVDGFSADITTCLSMSDFYMSFNNMPTSKTIILMDACFSGATRNDDMLYSARGVKIKPKTDRPLGNTVVISSAQGDETAYPYKDQNHGLFTYFMLKKLKDSKGEISLGSLFDYVKDSVTKKSLVINGKSQTPTASISDNIIDSWYNWKLN